MRRKDHALIASALHHAYEATQRSIRATDSPTAKIALSYELNGIMIAAKNIALELALDNIKFSTSQFLAFIRGEETE